MKNSLKKLLALVLVLSMALCFAACGEDKDKGKDAEREIEDYIASQQDEKDKGKDAEKEIEDYIETYQDELDEIIASFEEQGIEVEVYPDGSSLVYEYTLDFSVPDDSIEQFKEGAKSSESQLESAADIIFNECDAVEEVVYVYYDADDTLLCKFSFER